MSSLLFDESLFVDGSILNGYDNIGVSNKADKFLVEKYQKKTVAICGESISINPKFPCNKINIYTMDNKNKSNNVKFYSFNQINVVNDIGVKIYVGELKTVERPFDISETLSSYESAVMVKYFAMKVPISITQALYLIIKKHFQDDKSWFNINRNEQNTNIIQYKNNEIGFKNTILNVPTITYFSDPINF